MLFEWTKILKRFCQNQCLSHLPIGLIIWYSVPYVPDIFVPFDDWSGSNSVPHASSSFDSSESCQNALLIF